MEKYSNLVSERVGLLKIPIRERSMAQNARLIVLSTTIQDLDKAIGRTHRPIGNYEAKFKDVFSKD